MRIPFSTVFNYGPGMPISPKVRVRIGGVEMGPGVSFGNGVSIGGLDIASIAGKELDVEISNGVYTILGYFQ